MPYEREPVRSSSQLSEREKYLTRALASKTAEGNALSCLGIRRSDPDPVVLYQLYFRSREERSWWAFAAERSHLHERLPRLHNAHIAATRDADSRREMYVGRGCELRVMCANGGSCPTKMRRKKDARLG